MKQHSPSCDRNKDPILDVLRGVLTESRLVLEIGSGSGQHAVHFASHLPHVRWQPTDLTENLPSISAWRDEAGAGNLLAPLALDLFAADWPVSQADAIVCINTIHIVSWAGVEYLFTGAGRVVQTGGVIFTYGPFRYSDRPLAASNEDFDRWLKARDPVSGIRDFDAVDGLARGNGFVLEGDVTMPANNRSLWWRKQ